MRLENPVLTFEEMTWQMASVESRRIMKPTLHRYLEFGLITQTMAPIDLNLGIPPIQSCSGGMSQLALDQPKRGVCLCEMESSLPRNEIVKELKFIH
jgi:hypothetical protein